MTYSLILLIIQANNIIFQYFLARIMNPSPSQLPLKINIRIQSEQKPFIQQVSPTDTFITLKNRLYLNHEKIVDLSPFINGKIQVKSSAERVLDTISRYNQFVFLGFSSSNNNGINDRVINTKSIGLSDTGTKLPSPTLPTPIFQPTIKQLTIEQKLTKPAIGSTTGTAASTSTRVTDLTHEQMLSLLNLLKISHGRYLNEQLQITTSVKKSLNYNIEPVALNFILEDKGVSHFFHSQSISETAKSFYQQGYNNKQLSNRVPYLFAFCLEEEQNYANIQKNIERYDYTYVEHCFPRGQINLWGLGQANFQVSEQMYNYFNNQDFSYRNILTFYRNFGQFFIKKFTIGLKRVCQQKIVETLHSTANQQSKQFSSLAATRIKQYMLQTASMMTNVEKTSSMLSQSDQSLKYDIKAIGGAIQYSDNVQLWKQSINKWELWRIIAVGEVVRVEDYLSLDVKNRILTVLGQRKGVAQQIGTTNLGDAKFKSGQPKVMKANMEIVASFKQKVYQMFIIDQQPSLKSKSKQDKKTEGYSSNDEQQKSSGLLIIIFIDRIVSFNLQTNKVQFQSPFTIAQQKSCLSLSIPVPISMPVPLPFPFQQPQPDYMTACQDKSDIYIATQLGILCFNFRPDPQKSPKSNKKVTMRSITRESWRWSTFLTYYKNKLYANGYHGIYQICPIKDEYKIVVGGDWRFYTGTRINNLVYLFYWNVYCLDLDNMIYAKVAIGQWNCFWGSYRYPWNDGTAVWHLYKDKLYQFRTSPIKLDKNKKESGQNKEYRVVQFSKNGMKINQFEGHCGVWRKVKVQNQIQLSKQKSVRESSLDKKQPIRSKKIGYIVKRDAFETIMKITI